jgi:PAS domain-containing protein
MRPSWLSFLLLLAGACWTAAFLLLLPPAGHPAVRAALPLFVAALALTLAVLVRLARFRRRLFRLVRRLLAGDYETGIGAGRARPADEVTTLERLLDRLTDQLREYDVLRAARIRAVQRALDLLLRHMAQPAMLFDVRREIMECNPRWREMFDIAQQSVSLSSLEHLPANAPFLKLLRQAVVEEKGRQQASVCVQMLPHESPCEIDLRIVPVKSGDGDIPFALVLSQPPDVASPGPDTTPPA